MKGKKILVTGATGQVARPIAEFLAKDNEVWCAARFSNAALKKEVEASGIKTFKWSLGSSDFQGLPTDFNYLVHSAWNIYETGGDFDKAISDNSEGTGLLMSHLRNIDAMLFVSALVIYRPRDSGTHAYTETGEGYGNPSPFAPAYSISKVAGEATIRTLSRVFNIPVTMARLGIAYGTYGHGGRPTRTFKKLIAGEPIYITSRRNLASLIHEDDLANQVEPLLKAATVPPTIVNWASDELVDELEVYKYIGRIAGIEPKFIVDDQKAIQIFAGDPAARRAITGPSQVGWKAGILKSLRTTFPDHTFLDVP